MNEIKIFNKIFNRAACISLFMLSIFIFPLNIYCQEFDITPALKFIERGKVNEAIEILNTLKQGDPKDPSVIFLDAVLTKNGEEALKKYTLVFEKFPNSKFADASLYRAFSYNYALGLYKKAEVLFAKLKSQYPSSTYILAANRKIPDEELLIVEKKDSTNKVVAPPIQNTPVDSTKIVNKFTIQIGAFLNAPNANRLKEQMTKEGYITQIVSKEIGGSIFNIVNTGRFATEEEAKALIQLLEKKFSIKGSIVPIQ